jgi:hypothetical protein
MSAQVKPETAQGPASQGPRATTIGGLPAYPSQAEPGYYGPRQYGPNGYAIWCFTLGLAGAVPLSLLLGVIALGKIRDTGQRGRWLAISGMVLAVLWIPVLARTMLH